MVALNGGNGDRKQCALQHNTYLYTHRHTYDMFNNILYYIYTYIVLYILYTQYMYMYMYNKRLRRWYLYCLNRERAYYTRVTIIRRIIIGLSWRHIWERSASCFRLSHCTVLSVCVCMCVCECVCVCICISYLSARREVPPATDKTAAVVCFRCAVVGKTRIAKLTNSFATLRGRIADSSSLSFVRPHSGGSRSIV